MHSIHKGRAPWRLPVHNLVQQQAMASMTRAVFCDKHALAGELRQLSAHRQVACTLQAPDDLAHTVHTAHASIGTSPGKGCAMLNAQLAYLGVPATVHHTSQHAAQLLHGNMQRHAVR